MIQTLKAKLSDLEGKFLHSHNVTSMKPIELNRRRTWCPTSTLTPLILPPVRQEAAVPIPPFLVTPSERYSAPEDHEFANEIFEPADQVDLNRTLSPGGRTTNILSSLIHTPRGMQRVSKTAESPNPLKIDSAEGMMARIKFLEEELSELNDFKKIENTVGEDHKKLTSKLQYANEHIATLEQRIAELEGIIEANSRDEQLKNALVDREKAEKAKIEAENILTSVEYQHELSVARAAKREAELVKSLDEARDESQFEKVKELEEKLRKADETIFNLQSSSPPTAEQNNIAVPDDRLAELEKCLEEANNDRKKLELSLQEKRNEVSRIMVEYDELSTQLMDSIQDNEILSKKLKQLEAAAEEAPPIVREVFEALTVKCNRIEAILNSIRNDEEPPAFEDNEQDETVTTLLQLREGLLEWRQNESYVRELQGEVERLRNQNEALSCKLPTIQESFAEPENELKDMVDSLSFELSEVKSQLEAELSKSIEASENAEKLSESLVATTKSYEQVKAEIALRADNDLMVAQTIDELKLKLVEADEEQTALTSQIARLTNELDEKTDKVKELEDALTQQELEMTSEIAELKEGLQRIMSLGEENARLKQGEKESKRLMNELTVKMDNMEKRSDELAEAKMCLEAQKSKIAELEQNEAIINENLTELKSKLAAAHENAALLEAEKNIFFEENKKLNELKDQFNSSKTLLLPERPKDVELASANTSTNTTQEFEAIAQTALSEQAEALRIQLVASDDKIKALEGELSKATEKTTELNSEITFLRTEASDSHDKIVQFEIELKLANREKIEAQDDIARLNEKIDELSSQKAEISAKLLSAESEFKQLESQSRAAQNEASNEIESINAKLEDLQAALATKEETIAILESQISDKNHEIEGLQKISEATSQKEELHRQLAEAKQELNVSKEATNELRAQIELMTAELEVLKSEKDALDEDFHSLDSKAKQLVIELDKSNQNLRDCQMALAKNDAEKTNLQSKLLLADQEISAMAQQIKTRNDDFEEIKNRYRRRSADFEANRNTLEMEKSDLQQQIGVIEAKKAGVDHELQKMRNEYLHVIEYQVPLLQAEVDQLKAVISASDEKHAKEMSDAAATQSAELNQLMLVKNQLEKDVYQLKERSSEETNRNFQLINDLEAKKKALEVELAALKQQQLVIDDNHIASLQKKIEQLANESNDNDMKYAILDEKHSQLLELNSKLEAELEVLRKQSKPQFDSVLKMNERLEREVEQLNEKIAQQVSETFVHNKTIADLRIELERLLKQTDEQKKVVKKVSSPDIRERGSSDLYPTQKQQMLIERGTPSRASDHNSERKYRRQNAHDERRRLSAWEQFTDASTQTDPVSDICACSELTKKVKDLQIEVRKRDCKISTMEHMSQHNPLKADLDEAKKSLTREQHEHKRTKSKLDAMFQTVPKLEMKIDELSKNQAIKKEVAVRSCQTSSDALVDKADFEQLQKKLNEMKYICNRRQEKILELETKGKENVAANFSTATRVIENENAALKKKIQEFEQMQTDDVKASIKSDFEQLKLEFDDLKSKYEVSRRLCNLRNVELKKLVDEIGELKEALEKLQKKYDKAKLVMQHRQDKINTLRVEQGEPADEKKSSKLKK